MVHKEIVSGIELTLTNAQEILSMGGPYTVDVYMGDKLISNNCIADNFIFNEDLKLLFFVKYHQYLRKSLKLSKTKSPKYL